MAIPAGLVVLSNQLLGCIPLSTGNNLEYLVIAEDCKAYEIVFFRISSFPIQRQRTEHIVRKLGLLRHHPMV